MSDLSKRKTTRRDFLKVFGLSSASILAPGLLTDEFLAQSVSHSPSHQSYIPVAVLVKPNVFLRGHTSQFGSIVVFPIGYKVADVNVSSVKCEGARAVESIVLPDERAIAFLHNTDELRHDLPCGLLLSLNLTGRLFDGSTFGGTDTVAIISAHQTVIYHTSTRKRRSCRACKKHAVNRIYPSRHLADGNRAHPGCNCRILEERLGWQNYVKAFWPSSRGGLAVYDRRWGWPPPSPAGLDLECPPALKEHLRRG
jgi:hypothetical protein